MQLHECLPLTGPGWSGKWGIVRAWQGHAGRVGESSLLPVAMPRRTDSGMVLHRKGSRMHGWSQPRLFTGRCRAPPLHVCTFIRIIAHVHQARIATIMLDFLVLVEIVSLAFLLIGIPNVFYGRRRAPQLKVPHARRNIHPADRWLASDDMSLTRDCVLEVRYHALPNQLCERLVLEQARAQLHTRTRRPGTPSAAERETQSWCGKKRWLETNKLEYGE